MLTNHEKRIVKLERKAPAKSLPWIQLITDEGESLEDAFAESGYSGSMEDYSIIHRVIVDPPKGNNGNDFKHGLHPIEAN